MIAADRGDRLWKPADAEMNKIVRRKNHPRKIFHAKFGNEIHSLSDATEGSLEWPRERFYPIGFAA
jgi:hypothetical protein